MTQTLYEIVQETTENEIYSGAHEGQINIQEFNEKPSFEASTHMKTKEIDLKYNPEYENKNQGKTKIITRDITRHEINHHKYKGLNGCPKNLEKHVELFYEPMAEVLLEKGFSHEDVKYVTNTLEDTILHKDLNKEFALDGISYFFEEVGNSQEKNKQRKKKFTEFYEAHVKLNMSLWGNKQQKKLLKKFYTHNKEITEVMKSFLEKTQDYDFLDENNWKDIAKIYAEEFSKLMKPEYALPLLNHSGKGTKGKESEEVEEGNVFDKQMKTKEFKKQRIKKAYSSGQETPNWMDSFEAMDLLYESLAQKLEIKAKTFTEEKQMPVVHYGKRDFNPEKDNLKHTTFGIDDNGKIGLKKKRWHYDIPIEIKRKPMSFPKMRFGLLDTSSSMEDDVHGGDNVGNTKIIPWGDKSKYHYALLGWYGFLEYLKQNHLMKQSNIDLANFSRETFVGKGLSEAKKAALTPQFDGTNIDLDSINYFFEGRDNLIFTISDGGINNWSSIKDNFIENAKKHQYFHLQIGDSTSTTKDLENAGLYVECISNAQDLANKTIDLTDKLFRKGK